MPPIFSVIMPVYNAESTVANSIKSVINQTFKQWELILVNDGSTDNSSSICEDLSKQDSRLSVYNKPNGGVSSARNLGLEKARGEWLCFIDADDIVFDSWLEHFYNIIITDECQMVNQGLMTDKRLSPSVKKKQFGINFKADKEEAISLLFSIGILGYIVIKCFKRDIVINKNIRFDENLRFKEDGMFVIEYMSQIQKVISIDYAGYFYYVPEWSKKYVMGDMTPYIRHIKDSLKKGNHNVFDYCVSECTNILYDSYIINSPDKKENLNRMYDIIQDYKSQKAIKTKNKKFLLLKYLYSVDAEMRFSSFILSCLVEVKEKLKRTLAYVLTNKAVN